MNVRSRARFAQKTRPRTGILRHFSVDNLEGCRRVQDCIAGAVSYGHCSGTELDRETIRADLDFKVGVPQQSGRQSTPSSWFFHLVTVREKAKANEATQALPSWTALSQRPSTCRARPRNLRLRLRTFETNAFVVHAQALNSSH
jgi:hypothetical protein